MVLKAVLIHYGICQCLWYSSVVWNLPFQVTTYFTSFLTNPHFATKLFFYCFLSLWTILSVTQLLFSFVAGKCAGFRFRNVDSKWRLESKRARPVSQFVLSLCIPRTESIQLRRFALKSSVCNLAKVSCYLGWIDLGERKFRIIWFSHQPTSFPGKYSESLLLLWPEHWRKQKNLILLPLWRAINRSLCVQMKCVTKW
jgi:hypothetical protein